MLVELRIQQYAEVVPLSFLDVVPSQWAAGVRYFETAW